MDYTSLLSANCLLRGLNLLGTKLNKQRHGLLRRASDRCLPMIAGLPDYMESRKLPRWYANHKQSNSNNEFKAAKVPVRKTKPVNIYIQTN